jgi:hypothetical protein
VGPEINGVFIARFGNQVAGYRNDVTQKDTFSFAMWPQEGYSGRSLNFRSRLEFTLLICEPCYILTRTGSRSISLRLLFLAPLPALVIAQKEDLMKLQKLGGFASIGAGLILVLFALSLI